VEIGPILRAMARNKVKVGLLVLEIALTTAIVLNCLAMLREQAARVGRPSGMDEANLLAVTIQPFGAQFQDAGFLRDLVQRDMAALRALPDVADATQMGPIPLQGGGSSTSFKPLGAPDTDKVRAPVYFADEHVLSTLGLELVEGRALASTDAPEGSGPQISNCLVTRDLADAVYPGQSPIGKLIESGDPDYPDVIVGVVRRMVTPYGGGPMESRIVIYPAGSPFPSFQSYLVRAKPGGLNRLVASLDDTLIGVEPDRVIRVQTLLEIKGLGYALNRLQVQLVAVIMALLLTVTALGIFGTTSFSVTQRIKQIGTRRALGATRPEILRYFLVENTLISLLGILLGLAGAYALNVVLVTRYAGSKLELGLVGVGVLILWLVGVAATVVPARRASRLSPALATRTV
jgi:putative ABC transport system permease protein